MAKHTPKPWVIQPENVSHDVGMPDHKIIGQVLGIQICHVYTDNGQDLANARLIAAAPELLEALKAVVGDCRCSLRERDSGHLTDCSVPVALEVIARAEGRS